MEDGLHNRPEGDLTANVTAHTFPQYKVKTDKCEDAYWEECEDQTKKVPFQVREELASHHGSEAD